MALQKGTGKKALGPTELVTSEGCTIAELGRPGALIQLCAEPNQPGKMSLGD